MKRRAKINLAFGLAALAFAGGAGLVFSYYLVDLKSSTTISFRTPHHAGTSSLFVATGGSKWGAGARVVPDSAKCLPPKTLLMGNSNTFAIDAQIAQGELSFLLTALDPSLKVDDTHKYIGKEQAPLLKIALPKRLSAALVGSSSDVEIRATGSPTIQKIDPFKAEKLSWAWYVEPKAVGKRELTMTISSYSSTDSDGARLLRQFCWPIEVEQGYLAVLARFIGNNWQWLWTFILIPIGRYLVKGLWEEDAPVEG